MEPIILLAGGALALSLLSKRTPTRLPDGTPTASIPAVTTTGAPAPPPVPGNYADSRTLLAIWNQQGYYLGRNLTATTLNASVNYFCWAQIYMPLYSAAVGTNIRFNPSVVPGYIDNMARLSGLSPITPPRTPATMPTPPPGRPPRGFGDGTPLVRGIGTPGIGIDPVTITAIVAAGITLVRTVINIFSGDGDGAATLINANMPAINSFYNSLGLRQTTRDNATTLLVAMRFDLAALEIVGALQRGEANPPAYAPMYDPAGSRTQTFTPYAVAGLPAPDATGPTAGGTDGFFQVVDTVVDLGESAVNLYQSFNQAGASDAAAGGTAV